VAGLQFLELEPPGPTVARTGFWELLQAPDVTLQSEAALERYELQLAERLLPYVTVKGLAERAQ